MLMNSFSSLIYVQMDRLSLVVTGEIKYTEQYYCYQFYLIAKKTTTLQEDTIAWKKYIHVYQTIS